MTRFALRRLVALTIATLLFSLAAVGTVGASPGRPAVGRAATAAGQADKGKPSPSPSASGSPRPSASGSPSASPEPGDDDDRGGPSASPSASPSGSPSASPEPGDDDGDDHPQGSPHPSASPEPGDDDDDDDPRSSPRPSASPSPSASPVASPSSSASPSPSASASPSASPSAVPSAAPSGDDRACFDATGQCVEGEFLRHWRANGGLAINGLPLTAEREERLEDGKVYRVQYFERARFEYHPENAGTPYTVLLGQFGRLLHPADAPTGARPESHYFAETGHNVGGDFLAYWRAHGGLMQFGLPLSEEFQERLEDGNLYTVQYFERARLEYHPENAGTPYVVLLGQFGRRILAEGSGRR